MAYDDLKENGSEAAVKAAGKLRQQGKPYESMCSTDSYNVYLFIHSFLVVDGDIAYWKAGG
jgi:obg-like ATPase 1